METSIFRDTLVYTLLMKVKLLIREYNIHKQTTLETRRNLENYTHFLQEP